MAWHGYGMASQTFVCVLIVTFTALTTLFFERNFNFRGPVTDTDVAIEILRHYEGISCPKNFTLYRLTDAHDVYAIQTTRKENGQVLLKRCEIFPLTWTEAALLPVIQGITSVVNTTEEVILKHACHNVSYLTESGDVVEDMHEEMEVPVEEYEGRLIRTMDTLEEAVEEQEQAEHEEETRQANSALWSVTQGIYPGTLWCGLGNIADDHYNKLGPEAEADACCRAHDHCKPLIEPYKTRYHQANPTLLPYSHCSCDIEFYNCMRRAGTATAREIGRIFFNLTKMKCFDFELKEVCIPGWFGWCSEKKQTCGAVVREHPAF